MFRIAILVDLELSEKSGGHVKFWERICSSLKNEKLDCNLEIFFLGKFANTINVSKNIKFRIQKPIVSSRILKIIGIDADYTDLFPFNLRLFFQLRSFDVIHTTDQLFSMSKTAIIASRFWRIPLTTSYHTDAPSYSRYYIKKIITKFPKFISRFLIDKVKLPKKIELSQRRKILKYFKKSNFALANNSIGNQKFSSKEKKENNIIELSRGIEKEIFKEKKINKRMLLKKLKIPLNDKIIFFCGRIHELKGALLLSEIHASLKKTGHNLTTILSGENFHGELCKQKGGDKLIILNYLSPKEVAKFMNVCDLFVLPSRFETGPQVVLEAKSCNAVCVVSPDGGGKAIKKNFFDGIIVKNYRLVDWTAMISNLLKNPKKIKSIKTNIRNQKDIITWREVFFDFFYNNWEKLHKKNE
tara:strand:+ start:4784 stop:6025 length:1242 start_codon:yes stop_codon:yes gene_type:complete